MEKTVSTVGYTESPDFRCLEDLKEVGTPGPAAMISLDYCGWERCRSGYAFGPYIRENYVIHIILEGKGTLYREGKVYHLAGNQAFLLRPGIETTYQADVEDPWTYTWIGFHGYQSRRILEDMGFADDCDVIDVRSAEVLGEYIDNIIKHRQLTYAHHLKRTAYMELVIGELLEYAAAADDRKTCSEEGYVNLAVEYIETNYSRTVRVAEIAGLIGINRSYLSEIFKKRIGVSPKQFLVDCRMQKAAELLYTTDLAVRAIAAMVGYSDPLTFSKAFKQKYGVNPSSYREQVPVLQNTQTKGNYVSHHKL